MIDLSQLPPPDVVEVPEFQTLVDEYVDWLAARDPLLAQLDQHPADPAWHVVHLLAYRELLLREKINDGVRSLLLGTSWGTNLDHLGVPEGVERRSTETETGAVVLEPDDDYRHRIHLRKRAIGAGVIEAYESAALAADARVSTVLATSPDPATVVLEWVPAIGVDPDDYETIQSAVEAAIADVSAPWRMIGDRVTVTRATPTTWDVVGTLLIEPGPDPATVVASAIAALRAYDLASRRPRHPRVMSAIHAALTVVGVVGVVLTSPSSTVDGEEGEFLELGDVELAVEVASWLGG
jgi:phage-related baseplate assembly protein